MRCLKVSVLFFLSRSSDNRFIKVPYVLVLVIFLLVCSSCKVSFMISFAGIYLPVVIFLLSPLHAHLPRPQRLGQTPCQARRPGVVRLLWRVSAAAAVDCAHAYGAISRGGRWCWLLAAYGSFRWRGRGRFCFCRRSAGGGAVDAVCGCRRRRCGNGAGDGLRRSWRRDGFGIVFC